MSILTFPSVRKPYEVSWRLRGATQMHTSPFDGSTQTLTRPGAAWEATLSWPALEQADARTMEAFLASMLGAAGRFYYGPPHAPRRATGSGSPTINGGSQSGSTLSLAGFSASAQAFLAGDWLSYTDTTGRARLHQVTANVTANGSGVASVPIAPPIRRAGNNGAAVNITAPTGVFRLADDGGGEVRTRPLYFSAVTLSIVEALV